jgi:hypothetical protein
VLFRLRGGGDVLMNILVKKLTREIITLQVNLMRQVFKIRDMIRRVEGIRLTDQQFEGIPGRPLNIMVMEMVMNQITLSGLTGHSLGNVENMDSKSNQKTSGKMAN